MKYQLIGSLLTLLSGTTAMADCQMVCTDDTKPTTMERPQASGQYDDLLESLINRNNATTRALESHTVLTEAQAQNEAKTPNEPFHGFNAAMMEAYEGQLRKRR